MSTYKLSDILKTLEKLFKNDVNTTKKIIKLKWQDLDKIGDFTPSEKSLIMDLKFAVEENNKPCKRNTERNGIIEFLAGNTRKEE